MKYLLSCCFDTQLLQMLFASLQQSHQCTPLTSHGIYRMMLRTGYWKRWISAFAASIKCVLTQRFLRDIVDETTLNEHNQHRERLVPFSAASLFNSLFFLWWLKFGLNYQLYQTKQLSCFPVNEMSSTGEALVNTFRRKPEPVNSNEYLCLEMTVAI